MAWNSTCETNTDSWDLENVETPGPKSPFPGRMGEERKQQIRKGTANYTKPNMAKQQQKFPKDDKILIQKLKKNHFS